MRQTEQEEISMIGDEEMAWINIEASAALAQWIELMRADDSHFSQYNKSEAPFRSRTLGQ